MKNKCLYCYEDLDSNQLDFHSTCAKKIFGTPKVPELPYTHENISSLAEKVIHSQTTITGVQPKLSLDISDSKQKGERKRFTIVGLWGRYILKPQTDMYVSLPELEDLTMHLAEIAKINTVPHSLIRFADGELCYITRRIDRDKKGNKYPMEDMCQLAERLTEYKYKGSYEQIAKLIFKYSSVPMLDMVNFWEQVYFCWLTGNSDMHLKNFSLYSIRKGVYSLTPAYDMLSTKMVMPEDVEELALTLNGKKNRLKRTDFELAFSKFGLDEKVQENIFLKFENILPQWFEFIDRSFLSDTMKAQYKEYIQKRITSVIK